LPVTLHGLVEPPQVTAAVGQVIVDLGRVGHVGRGRPELLDRWEVLRAAKEEDGQVIFTFLFYGGEAAEWQMEPILAQALGAEGARRALENMLAMMKGLQHGWELTPVDLAS